MRLALLVLPAAWLGISCSDQPPADATSVDLGEGQPNERPAESLARQAPSKLAPLRLGQGPYLGASCPAAPTTQAAGKAAAPEVCGSAGRVSLEVGQLMGLQLPRCDVRVLGDKAVMSPDQRELCVDGDHLFVAVRCVMCRMPDTGKAVHARLSELTPAQHAYLHQMLGLPVGPTSAQGWAELARR